MSVGVGLLSAEGSCQKKGGGSESLVASSLQLRDGCICR